ncbi:hypothetical protein [Ammoniphilus sp. 3BR4]|uniref:hypothetical protein n=1 Tax=Ammoniphilus sp. 3BR4 TaxID=3158265 RepID=UPI003467BB8E
MQFEKAKEVITEFERLSDKDKDSLSIALEKYFGKQIEFSLTELSQLDEKDLKTIQSTIGGMIMTRENVTDDIGSLYEKFKDKDLPNRISFGRLPSEKEWLLDEYEYGERRRYFSSAFFV